SRKTRSRKKVFSECAEISACDSIRGKICSVGLRDLQPSVCIAVTQVGQGLKFVRLRAPHPERYKPPELARSLCAGAAGEGSRPDTRDLRPRAPSHPESSA